MTKGRKDNGELLRIGQLAQKAGISIRTLRYYEEIGLVQPVGRTESGYRLYDQEALRQLRMIKRMKMLSLKLGEIRRLAETYEKAGVCDPVRRQLRDLLRVHMQHIDEQIAELTLLKQTLQQYLDRPESYFRATPAEQAEQRCHGAMAHAETLIK